MSSEMIVSHRAAQLLKGRYDDVEIAVGEIQRHTGLSRQTIYNWLDSPVLTSYSGKAIIAWCKFLKCTVADLLVIEAAQS